MTGSGFNSNIKGIFNQPFDQKYERVKTAQPYRKHNILRRAPLKQPELHPMHPAAVPVESKSITASMLVTGIQGKAVTGQSQRAKKVVRKDTAAEDYLGSAVSAVNVVRDPELRQRCVRHPRPPAPSRAPHTAPQRLSSGFALGNSFNMADLNPRVQRPDWATSTGSCLTGSIQVRAAGKGPVKIGGGHKASGFAVNAVTESTERMVAIPRETGQRRSDYGVGPVYPTMRRSQL